MQNNDFTPGELPNEPISFVIPTKWDWRLGRGIAMLQSSADAACLDYEVVVCGVLPHPPPRLKRVRIIERLPAEKGAYVREGVLASTGNVIVVCDADIPVPFSDILTLVVSLNTADVAVGNRYLSRSKYRIHGTLRRCLSSLAFKYIVGALFHLRPYDTQCGIKAFSRPAARNIFASQIVRGLAYDVEVFLRAQDLGYTVMQYPVRWKTSIDSTIVPSQVAIKMLFDLFRLWQWQRVSRKGRQINHGLQRTQLTTVPPMPGVRLHRNE